MSITVITVITLGVVLCCAMILRWKQDAVIVLASPSEILLIGSKAERRRVYTEGKIAFLKKRSTWIAFICYTVALGVPGVLASAGLLTVADTRVGASSVMAVKLAAILCALIPALFLFPIMWVRDRRWMRVYVRQYLKDHGIPICQKCGYDLRGQGSPRCPECGTAFDGKDAADGEL